MDMKAIQELLAQGPPSAPDENTPGKTLRVFVEWVEEYRKSHDGAAPDAVVVGGLIASILDLKAYEEERQAYNQMQAMAQQLGVLGVPLDEDEAKDDVDGNT